MSRGSGITPEYAMHCESVSVHFFFQVASEACHRIVSLID